MSAPAFLFQEYHPVLMSDTPASVTTYLPENLDLAGIVPPGWREYAAWFVGGLYLRRHTEKYADADEFRRVSSALIRRVLPSREYKKILNALTEAGVVERDDSYCTATPDRPGWSKGYRLTATYREARFRRVELRHHELVRKVGRLRQSERERFSAPVHRHLRDVLDRLEVCPDAPDDFALERVRNREFSFSVCRYGRVHTNLTNLAGDLRRHLRMD